jgi:hypothetical protein
MNGGFSHNGKTLLSGVDPAGKADKIAAAVPISEGTLYLCPSPLFGYGLERLLSRLDGIRNSALLCIEADPALYALAREHFPPALAGPALAGNPQLRLTGQCNAAALCALLRREWGPRFFRRVEVVRLNGGWQLFPALYAEIAEALQREIALDWGNAITLARLGRLYMRNAVRNLALIPLCPSLRELSWGRGPALVLGAGPSLDKTLDSLASRFGQTLRQPTRPFKIICADTCLSSLHERGIPPDLAVILESQHWNLADFTGLSGWGVPAAMDLSALPASGAVLGGGLQPASGLFLFFTPWTRLAVFDRLNAAGLLPHRLPPLGSVGLSAVAIARLLTGGGIIVAGLDFSFTLDSYHARSTPGHKRRLNTLNRFSSLLNADAAFGPAAIVSDTAFNGVSNGSRVFTSPALRKYRDLFEREFANDPRIFNFADNGLSLGVPALSPEDAFTLLSSGGGTDDRQRLSAPSSESAAKGEALAAFMQAEQDRLLLLRDMLCGAIPVNYKTLNTLIDECDYLWAHFPDYAASDRRPAAEELEAGTAAAVSFLKRVRVEIDPFMRLFAKC